MAHTRGSCTFVCDPGSCTSYSSTNYILAGLVLLAHAPAGQRTVASFNQLAALGLGPKDYPATFTPSQVTELLIFSLGLLLIHYTCTCPVHPVSNWCMCFACCLLCVLVYQYVRAGTCTRLFTKPALSTPMQGRMNATGLDVAGASEAYGKAELFTQDASILGWTCECSTLSKQDASTRGKQDASCVPPRTHAASPYRTFSRMCGSYRCHHPAGSCVRHHVSSYAPKQTTVAAWFGVKIVTPMRHRSAGGNVVASAQDVARFYWDLLGPSHSVVSDASLKTMSTMHTLDRGWAKGEIPYGYGLMIQNVDPEHGRQLPSLE